MFGKAGENALYHSEFINAYLIDRHKKVLINILGVSLVIELIYAFIAGVILKGSPLYSPFVDPFYLSNMYYFLAIYIGLDLLVYFLFHKLKDFLGALVLFFLLYQKIWIFLRNPASYNVLLIWCVLSLVISLNYLRPHIVVPVTVGTFFILLMEMFLRDLNYLQYSSHLWFIFLCSIISLIISIRNYPLHYREYEKQQKLIEENEEKNRILHFDSMTGLHSRYFMNNYLKKEFAGRQREKGYLVMIDLDDLKLCNDLLGKEQGNQYLTVFSRIIRFLALDGHDKIARVGGDEFIALLFSYKSPWEIEEKLNRYNQMLKEEFDRISRDERIVPNFSYGIVKLDRESTYSELLEKAENLLQNHKKKNKEHPDSISLVRSHINYTSLLSAGNVVAIVWLPRKNWPIGYVTDNVRKLLGFTAEEILREEILFKSLIHPDDVERVEKEYSDYNKEGREHYEQSYRLRKKDGSYTWIRDYSSPVRRGDKITQVNGYFYDINEEIEARTLIEEGAERLRNIVSATNVGTWEWNLKNGDLVFNDRFAEMIGYSPETIRPFNVTDWENLLHPDDLDRFREVVDEYLSGKRESYEIKVRIRHKSGHWVWVHDKGRIMKWDDEGTPLIMFGSQSDITELKETETMLEHSEKMGALGRMAGGIAHDLNNQLMKISSIAEMAPVWDSKEHYRSSAETIKQLADSAGWIVHELLFFAGNQLFEPELCDLSLILRDLTELLDHTFEKEIRISSDIPEESLWIYADKAQLKKSFFNICYNAKEAMVHGGKLFISAETVEADKGFVTLTGDLPPGTYGKLIFRDEGEGIDEESLHKIFEPFFTTRDYGTQGLGLSKVASVLRELKGGVQVKSERGEGSEFSLFLPLLKPQKPKAPVGKELSPVKVDRSREILIIDDEKVICDLLVEFFAFSGWKARSFTNPLDGIEYYREAKDSIGLVILDMRMPEMPGHEVFKRMKSVQPTVRVLFLSGYSQGFEINEKNQANIAGYMVKPVKLDDLKELVEGEL